LRARFNPNELGELLAVVVVVVWAWALVLIKCDNQFVVDRFKRICEARATHQDLEDFALEMQDWDHAQLWKLLVENIQAHRPSFYDIMWIKAHATEEHVDEGLISTLDRKGNHAADSLASNMAAQHPLQPSKAAMDLQHWRTIATVYAQAMYVKVAQKRAGQIQQFLRENGNLPNQVVNQPLPDDQPGMEKALKSFAEPTDAHLDINNLTPADIWKNRGDLFELHWWHARAVKEPKLIDGPVIGPAPNRLDVPGERNTADNRHHTQWNYPRSVRGFQMVLRRLEVRRSTELQASHGAQPCPTDLYSLDLARGRPCHVKGSDHLL